MVISAFISKKITSELHNLNIIKSCEYEPYTYCFEYLLDIAIYNISLLSLGFILKDIVATIIYILVMNSLKITAGGVHANKRITCSILSYAVFFLSIALSKHIYFRYIDLSTNLQTTFICSYIIVTGAILIIAPVLHPNQAINKENIAKLKFYCFVNLTIITVLFFTLIKNNQPRLYSLVFVCVIMILINQVLGIVIYKKRYKNESKYCNMR
ncbi:MAG: accessory gene regulator B family protein [Lachnospiraceae bacterium]|nr:accessory gene regulator B family protein [Lachnospiraceae bacterium]